jgi:hypothetical protein
MEIISDVPAFARARVKLSAGAAPRAAGFGPGARARITSPRARSVQGTGVSAVGAQPPVFGPTPTRNPYISMTRAAALGGGAVGPHPARGPDPV